MRPLLSCALVLTGASLLLCGETLSLDGAWRFQLDRDQVGVGERWLAGMFDFREVFA